MTASEIIDRIKSKFADAIVQEKLDGGDPWVAIAPERLFEIAQFLRSEPELAFDVLNCISGVDYLETDPKKIAKAGFEPHLEVVYHLMSFQHRHRFTLKILLPRWKENQTGQLPEVASVASIWATADWHEREVYDLSGIFFTQHPNLCRILLAEDWEGHPLRKDYEYPLEYHGIRCR